MILSHHHHLDVSALFSDWRRRWCAYAGTAAAHLSYARCEERGRKLSEKTKNSSTVSVSRNRFTHPKVRPREIFVCFSRDFFCVTRRQIPRVVSKSAQLSRLKSIRLLFESIEPEQKNKNRKWTSQETWSIVKVSPAVIFFFRKSREWKIIKIQAPIKIEKYLIFLSQKRTDHVVVDSAFYSLVLLFQLIGIESLRVLDSPQRCVASS